MTTRVVRFARLALHLLSARIVAAWVLPRIGPGDRARYAQEWAARLLAILGVRTVHTGYLPRVGQPLLLVANHISWLDPQVLHSATPARFVAKDEVRSWPLIGPTAARCGTFFMKRGSCRAAWRIKESIAAALKEGETVAVFPEGTTTDGSRVQSFYPALLQAAVDAGVAVCPVTIRYQTANGTGSSAVAFLGDMTFMNSLRRVLREPLIAVEVHFSAPIASRNRTRRELATSAQLAITEALAFSSSDALVNALRAAQRVPRRTMKPSVRGGAFPTAQAPATA